MKKIKIYFILLLLFGFSTAFSQALQSETKTTDPADKLNADPRYSMEEQALMLGAGEDNPAKIDESTQVDPKLTPEEKAMILTTGADNPAKIDESTQVDPRLAAEQAQIKSQPAKDKPVPTGMRGSQPEGEKVGAIVDFRDLQGSGNDQPPGETPAHVDNYRDISGPNTQPVGDTPDK